MRHDTTDLNGNGGVRLTIQSWQPADVPKAVVLLSHGYGEHLGRYSHVVDALVGRGYAVHGPDHRGHGASGGRRASVRRFDDFVLDLRLVAERARAAHPALPTFLLGHSMGGLIAARYALAHQAELAGLALSGAALRIGDDVSPAVRRLGAALARLAPDLPVLAGAPGVLSRDPEVERRFGADPLTYKGRLRAGLGHLMTLAAADTLARAADLTLPLLVMHGEADKLTNPQGSVLLHERASSADKTLRLWPELRHEIFNEPEGPEVIAVLTDWLDARVPAGG